ICTLREHHRHVLSHRTRSDRLSLFFFFNDTPTTAIYTLSLHDALPISRQASRRARGGTRAAATRRVAAAARAGVPRRARPNVRRGGGEARVGVGAGAAAPVIRRIPWLLAALPLLAVARLFPETGFGLWLRLAAATLVV